MKTHKQDFSQLEQQHQPEALTKAELTSVEGGGASEALVLFAQVAKAAYETWKSTSLPTIF
jgi:hypothetical protein